MTDASRDLAIDDLWMKSLERSRARRGLAPVGTSGVPIRDLTDPEFWSTSKDRSRRKREWRERTLRFGPLDSKRVAVPAALLAGGLAVTEVVGTASGGGNSATAGTLPQDPIASTAASNHVTKHHASKRKAPKAVSSLQGKTQTIAAKKPKPKKKAPLVVKTIAQAQALGGFKKGMRGPGVASAAAPDRRRAGRHLRPQHAARDPQVPEEARPHDRRHRRPGHDAGDQEPDGRPSVDPRRRASLEDHEGQDRQRPHRVGEDAHARRRGRVPAAEAGPARRRRLRSRAPRPRSSAGSVATGSTTTASSAPRPGRRSASRAATASLHPHSFGETKHTTQHHSSQGSSGSSGGGGGGGGSAAGSSVVARAIAAANQIATLPTSGAAATARSRTRATTARAPSRSCCTAPACCRHRSTRPRSSRTASPDRASTSRSTRTPGTPG